MPPPNMPSDPKDDVFRISGIEANVPLLQKHCFRPTPTGLAAIAKDLQDCLNDLCRDYPRSAMRRLLSATAQIVEMSPFINPSRGLLGGGLSEQLLRGEDAGRIEKTHLITNRLMLEEAKRQGIEYIDLGTDYHYPFYSDYTPTAEALAALSEHSHRATNYPSSYGIVELRHEFTRFMKELFGVELDSHRNVMITSGASQVFDAISRAFCGEYFIVPDLALPTVSTIAVANGAKPIRAPLDPETGVVDIQALERILGEHHWPTIRFMYINYPTNPTGAVATTAFFRRLVSFARKHCVLLLHDMDSWYTVHEEGIRLLNLLQTEGAMDVGVTMIAVSKEFGLPGLRIGLVAGNEQVISALRMHNSIYCTMLPEFCQFAVLAALRHFSAEHEKPEINRRVTQLMKLSLEGWRRLGWPDEALHPPVAGFKFLIEVPPGFSGNEEISRAELFDYFIVKNAKVKLSNSRSFNLQDSRFVRMVIMQDEERIQQVFRRLESLGVRYHMSMPPDLLNEYWAFLQHPAFTQPGGVLQDI